MTTGPSRHPSNWRLWHPNQGILFQQPSYPTLDFARFSTEASAPESRHDDAPGASLPTEPAMTEPSEEEIEHFARVDAPTREEMENSTTTPAKEDSTDAPADPDPFKDARLINTKGPAAIITPPFTPLEFTMPEEQFRRARLARVGSEASFWSHKLYRGPKAPTQEKDQPERYLGVTVTYCTNPEKAEEALALLEGEKCLGLDLEWVPYAGKYTGVRKNVSLVQLASPSRVVLLHLARYPVNKDGKQFVTPTLQRILEDPTVSKIGVWIKGDCQRLEKYLGIKVRGMFELSHLFNQVTHLANGAPELVNKKLVSLARQVLEVTGLPLSKDTRVRASDWSLPLNYAQRGYSANDAYAGVQLYAMLNHKRQELDPVPDLPFHAELDRPIPLPPGMEPPISDVEKEVSSDGAAIETDGSLEDIVLEYPDDDGVVSGQGVDANAMDAEASMDAPAKPAVKEPKARKRGPVDPDDPRIVAAEALQEEFASARKASGGEPKVKHAELRAYFLWHNNEGLSLDEMHRMLRIKRSTAASYILHAVVIEELPYDKVRLKAQVLRHANPITLRNYSGILRLMENGLLSPSTSSG